MDSLRAERILCGKIEMQFNNLRILMQRYDDSETDAEKNSFADKIIMQCGEFAENYMMYEENFGAPANYDEMKLVILRAIIIGKAQIMRIIIKK